MMVKDLLMMNIKIIKIFTLNKKKYCRSYKNTRKFLRKYNNLSLKLGEYCKNSLVDIDNDDLNLKKIIKKKPAII